MLLKVLPEFYTFLMLRRKSSLPDTYLNLNSEPSALNPKLKQPLWVCKDCGEGG